MMNQVYKGSLHNTGVLVFWLVIGGLLTYRSIDKDEYAADLILVIVIYLLLDILYRCFSFNYIGRVEINTQSKTIVITTRMIPLAQRMKTYHVNEVRFIRSPLSGKGRYASTSTIRLQDVNHNKIGEISTVYLFWKNAQIDELTDVMEKHLPPGSGSIGYLK